MNTYKCVVYNESRKRKVIKIDVESKNDVFKYIIQNKLRLVSIKKCNKAIIKKRLKDKDIYIICKQIAILLESGCEITKLLNILEKQSSKKLRVLLLDISNHIQKGNSITDAFLITKSFSNFFISMVKAGEVSGNLDKVMNNLSDYYKREYKLKNKLKEIMTYPMMLIISSILAIIFMLVKVIPSFSSNFIEGSINTPIMTRILIDISLFVRDNIWYLIIASIAFISTLFFYIATSSKIRDFINEAKFKIPGIKKINELLVANRFSRSLYILVKSGVHIVDAIDISSRVIDNNFAYEQILLASKSLKRGNGIGESLKLADIFPSIFISMINIGEESGKLDSSLESLTEFYDNEINAAIEEFTRLLEPTVIVVIGIIIGGGIIVMLSPMFDLINSI